jgi:hypothetical protein
VCGARLARTGRRDFDGLARATLYRFRYEAPNPIAISEMAELDPFGIFGGGGWFDETRLVFAVRTNDGRYAIVQAVQVDFNAITLRYRVWEKVMPSLQITGDFKCEGLTVGDPLGGSVVFQPSGALVSVLTGAGAVGGKTGGAVVDPCAGLTQIVRSSLPAEVVTATKLASIPLADRRIGRWQETVRFGRRPVGRFEASVDRFGRRERQHGHVPNNRHPSGPHDERAAGVRVQPRCHRL